MPDTFLLIDGHALIYRAYHAFGPLTTPDGTLVNAVYGFSRILLTVIKDFSPKYMAVAFDHPTATFRHTDFAGYKEHRAEMPDDLKTQIDLIKQVVTAFNIPQFEVPGYEADDVIGTICCQLEEMRQKDCPVMAVIVTGDRDTFQLVNDCVHVWMPGRGKGQMDQEYDAQGVIEKMGVRPDQIVDLKALMGDASDNIPGVPRIGEKTAARLIQAFGSLEGVYEAIQKGSTAGVLTPSVVKKLADGYDQALLSQRLARMDCAVPIKLQLAECRLSAYNKEKVLELFTQLNFKSLLSWLPADEFELEVQGALF